MFTVWEVRGMGKLLSIIKYEVSMQTRRTAVWGVLLAATAINLIDGIPSAANLARLEFLTQPDYFICRTMSLCGLILVYGLMILQSNRIDIDSKTGVKSLFMAAPMSKAQYIGGKLAGSFLTALTIIILYLVFNTIVYAIFNPVSNSFMEYLIPFVKTVLISVIPVSFFISLCAVALPVVMDIRLFYFLISIVFIVNAATVGSAERMPFYLITSGDLMKLIWYHPRYPFGDAASITANIVFLYSGGLISAALLLGRRKFWRGEL